jgi:hypothetical protein
MPIKDASIYPPYWRQFSEYIRFERAASKCERCKVPNYAVIVWDRFGRWHLEDEIHGYNSDVGDHLFPDDWKASKVVLTVAHLDADGDVCRCQDETGFLCAKPDHVKAMCQRCHNRYDRPKRNVNAQKTLAGKKDAARGLFQ